MTSRFKPAVAMQIRLPIELRERLESVKAETGKSVNQIINELIEKYVNNYEDRQEIA